MIQKIMSIITLEIELSFTHFFPVLNWNKYFDYVCFQKMLLVEYFNFQTSKKKNKTFFFNNKIFK